MTKVALIQMSGNIDRYASLQAQREWVKTAAAEGGQIVCFPELINVTYFCDETNPDYFTLAEPVDGPSVSTMCQIACEFRVVVIYSFFERVMEGEFYNTVGVIGPEGKLIGRYRKAHIPCSPPEDGRINIYNEKFYFKPGNLGFPVFKTPYDLSIGVLICYDRHYPEAARVLSLAGADLILVPATATGVTQEHWEQELRAHAWFNQCYVGGINRVGPDLGRTSPNYFGQSMFIDPSGQVLERADHKTERILFGEVDCSRIAAMRRQWPFLRDRRPELYGPITSLMS